MPPCLARLCCALPLVVAACGRVGFALSMLDDDGDAGVPSPDTDAGSSAAPARHPALIHRYGFDGRGALVTDSVGTAHGSAVNCEVSQGAVNLRKAVTGDYIRLPPGLISGLTAVTFEVWVKWNGGDPRQHILDFGNETMPGGSGTSFFMLEPKGSAGSLAAFVNFTPVPSDLENDLAVFGNGALSQSAIHQIAVTFDGRRLSLYLDGVRVGATDNPPQSLSAIDDQNNGLGRSQFAGDPELDATIYEFRIYDRALAAVEIASSFDLGSDLPL